MPVVPSQTRTLDPFADHRFSNSINRFTRLITGGKDVILPFDVNRSVFNVTSYIPAAYSSELHPYDVDRDFKMNEIEVAQANVDRINGFITQTQYDRVVELSSGYHFDNMSPDGFAPNSAITDTPWYLDLDGDWRIDDDEFQTIEANFLAYLDNRYPGAPIAGDVTSYFEYFFALDANKNGGYHYSNTGIGDAPYDEYTPTPLGSSDLALQWDLNKDWKLDMDEINNAFNAFLNGSGAIDPGGVQRLYDFFAAGGYHPIQPGEPVHTYFPEYSPGPLPAQKLKVGPGYLIRHDTLIHVKEDTIIDLNDNDNYIGTGPADYGLSRTGSKDGLTSNTKMYFLLAKYVYSRSKPEPELAFVIAKNRQAYLQNMQDYIYLASFEVDSGNGSAELGITKVYDWDTDENNSNARIERPMYFHHVSEVDGGTLNEFGLLVQSPTNAVSEP